MSDAPPPNLPSYGPPAPRKCAVLPSHVEVAEPDVPKGIQKPGLMAKMISKMLPKKLGKIGKAPRMKAKLPTKKPTKRRHIVHVK